MAANRLRGEVDFVVPRPARDKDGKPILDADGAVQLVPQTYTLKLTMNAGALAETLTGRKMKDLLGGSTDLDFVAMRAVMFALLQKHHGKEFRRPEDAGDLIDDAGGLSAFLKVVTDILELNTPEAKAAGDPPPAPAPAESGTGADSTPTPAA